MITCTAHEEVCAAGSMDDAERQNSGLLTTSKHIPYTQWAAVQMHQRGHTPNNSSGTKLAGGLYTAVSGGVVIWSDAVLQYNTWCPLLMLQTMNAVHQ